ncbi:sigma-70 family RNA polymerase sigma factor [Paenibacillus sp. MMS20-IR301]|uniref:RNA polymerase sigma factor n=1 Tax=Paenibacillus sp. MMS20-IR301 TaxID=2895946 RepID=UPI0028E76D68|nr:sigma-70 family RNA polymerase sigma factor [Paenibacillus sp. MMS20-IR301]WNS44638.1 sigma-70 family RNA polymerase sigma factor [Paenibacillus sp. MMS20-IR301]
MAKETINHFLQQTGTLLYRYLRKRGLAREDAEDIVQDTCYKYLLYKDGIGSNQAIGWMFRVATNQFYDLKRLDKRRPTVDVDEVQLVSLTHLPEIQLLRRETAQTIRDTLALLSEQHQELLILKYEMNLTYKDLSALYNKNENTLKTHVTRAKNNFIKHYEEDH